MDLGKTTLPRLKGFVYIIPQETSVQVRWDEHAVLLNSESAAKLVKEIVPLLDGTHTTDDVVSQLASWDRKDITDVMTFFNSHELLEDASIVSPFSLEQERQWEDQILYFSQFSSNKYSLQKRITDTCVLVLGEGVLLHEVCSGLEETGVRIHEAAESIEPPHKDERFESRKEAEEKIEARIAEARADLVVVTTSNSFSPLFSWVNSVSLTLQRPWTSCTVYGEKGLVGPTVVPGQTACYTCLRLRRSSNLVHYDEFTRFETYVEEHPGLQKRSGALTATLSVVAHLCVVELVKLITGIAPVQTAGGQISFNPLTMEMKVHPVLKLPRCPQCGLPSRERRTERVWMK